MTKWKHVLEIFEMKINNWYCLFTKVWKFFAVALRCGQMPPVCFNFLWDMSWTWLESTFGKWSWLDIVEKGTHLCTIQGPVIHTARRDPKPQTMKCEELTVDLHNKTVFKHWSGQRYTTISKAVSAPRSTVASVIVRVRVKKTGTTGTLPRVDFSAKLIDRA